jgi:hypothetical protein
LFIAWMKYGVSASDSVSVSCSSPTFLIPLACIHLASVSMSVMLGSAIDHSLGHLTEASLRHWLSPSFSAKVNTGCLAMTGIMAPMSLPTEPPQIIVGLLPEVSALISSETAVVGSLLSLTWLMTTLWPAIPPWSL